MTWFQILDEVVGVLLCSNGLEKGMDTLIFRTQLWINSRLDCVICHLLGTHSKKRKALRTIFRLIIDVALIFASCGLGYHRGVMVKAMDGGNVVNEFVLQWRYYVHFRTNTLGKCMNPTKCVGELGKFIDSKIHV